MFSVKTDETLFPDTFSVWAGSAYGIYRFIYTTNFSDDFSNGLRKWKAFGVPVPVVTDTITIGDSLIIGNLFDNMGDTLGNCGILSKKIFAGPHGFVMETDIYLQVTDTLGCYDEAGIGMPKVANPGWYGANNDSLPDAYGIIFFAQLYWRSPVRIQGCHRKPDIMPGLMQDFWMRMIHCRYSTPIQTARPTDYINNWQTLRILVDDNDSVKFVIISGRRYNSSLDSTYKT